MNKILEVRGKFHNLYWRLSFLYFLTPLFLFGSSLFYIGKTAKTPLFLLERIRESRLEAAFGLLKSIDKKEYVSILEKTADISQYLYALKLLSDCLKEAYNKNVIILIDEYDVPLESACFGGFYDEMVNLIRSVFESALKTNPSLEFGILTGCLRISRESIFTGLNNLKVNSITTLDFSEYFGFTEKEIKKFAEVYGLEKYTDEI